MSGWAPALTGWRPKNELRCLSFPLPQNKLGGGEGVEGLYGSVTKGGMQKVIASLRDKCGLDASSRLVDIGAGLGR